MSQNILILIAIDRANCYLSKDVYFVMVSFLAKNRKKGSLECLGFLGPVLVDLGELIPWVPKFLKLDNV